MKGRYTRRLKVSTPSNESIHAIITQGMDEVHIEVRCLEVVQKDDPPFARNGVISFNVAKTQYKETIEKLTSYLESLFFKQLDEEVIIDEAIYSSLGTRRESRGAKKPSKSRSIGSVKGTGSSAGVHSSTRGAKSAEGSGRGSTGDDVAESSDSPVDGKDKERD